MTSLTNGAARVIIVITAMMMTCSASRGDSAATEQLILLTHDDGSEVSRHVRSSVAPLLEQLASEMGLEFIERDVRDGAPSEIHSVPVIIFADHRGRSIYQGRYTTLDRVRNFVQTSRVFVQESRPRERADLPVLQRGRVRIGTPIKLTPLSGEPPVDFDAESFETSTRAAITAGLPGYERPSRTTLGRTDRLFYIDVHPYRDADGRLFLSTALFSQYHCHEPLMTRVGNPIMGTWASREQLLRHAASELAGWIDEAIADESVGDGFIALDSSLPTVTWDAMGLPLPPRPEGESLVSADLNIPESWRIDMAANAERPSIRFRFPAPLDSYSGQARDLTGELRVPLRAIGDAAGSFIVTVNSVTMGEPDLDDYLMTPEMLDEGQYPTARFELERAEAPSDQPLEFGVVIPFTMHGQFTMKGATIPLTVPAQLELTVGVDRRPRLILQGGWRVDLMRHFGLEGPDGPDDIRNTLEYTCRIVFEPAA